MGKQDKGEGEVDKVECKCTTRPKEHSLYIACTVNHDPPILGEGTCNCTPPYKQHSILSCHKISSESNVSHRYMVSTNVYKWLSFDDRYIEG